MNLFGQILQGFSGKCFGTIYDQVFAVFLCRERVNSLLLCPSIALFMYSLAMSEERFLCSDFL